MPSSRFDCPLSLKTPNMGNTGSIGAAATWAIISTRTVFIIGTAITASTGNPLPATAGMATTGGAVFTAVLGCVIFCTDHG